MCAHATLPSLGSSGDDNLEWWMLFNFGYDFSDLGVDDNVCIQNNVHMIW